MIVEPEATPMSLPDAEAKVISADPSSKEVPSVCTSTWTESLKLAVEGNVITLGTIVTVEDVELNETVAPLVKNPVGTTVMKWESRPIS
jgi:hypothetical protein